MIKTFKEYLQENNLSYNSNEVPMKHGVVDLVIDSIPNQEFKRLNQYNINNASDLKNLFKNKNWNINIPDEHWENSFNFLLNNNFIKKSN